MDMVNRRTNTKTNAAPGPRHMQCPSTYWCSEYKCVGQMSTMEGIKSQKGQRPQCTIEDEADTGTLRDRETQFLEGHIWSEY